MNYIIHTLCDIRNEKKLNIHAITNTDYDTHSSSISSVRDTSSVFCFKHIRS